MTRSEQYQCQWYLECLECLSLNWSRSGLTKWCCAANLAVKLADWVFIILVTLVTSHRDLGPPNTEKLRDIAGSWLVFKIADG